MASGDIGRDAMHGVCTVAMKVAGRVWLAQWGLFFLT
jgi:hypothetical protein